MHFLMWMDARPMARICPEIEFKFKVVHDIRILAIFDGYAYNPGL